MNIRDNINKIHSDLLNDFEQVSIFEKSNLEWGNYFELEISESNKLVRLIISRKELENKKFNWKYYSNPKGDLSYIVERESTVDNFSIVIKEIFEKNRFDSDYLKSLND
jgi:hypothetical protein